MSSDIRDYHTVLVQYHLLLPTLRVLTFQQIKGTAMSASSPTITLSTMLSTCTEGSAKHNYCNSHDTLVTFCYIAWPHSRPFIFMCIHMNTSMRKNRLRTSTYSYMYNACKCAHTYVTLPCFAVDSKCHTAF